MGSPLVESITDRASAVRNGPVGDRRKSAPDWMVVSGKLDIQDPHDASRIAVAEERWIRNRPWYAHGGVCIELCCTLASSKVPAIVRA